MNVSPHIHRWMLLPQRLRAMFNLNDPRWGRGDNKGSADAPRPDSNQASPPPEEPAQDKPQDQRPPPPRHHGGGQPPDLDELWRDFNRRLTALFGGGKGGGRGQYPGGPKGSGDLRGAGIGIGLLSAIAVLIWLASGLFIVNEGRQAVITQFGRYHSTVGAGINWRLPYPVQRHEIVVVSQLRSADVGSDNIVKSTGLRESAMLTEDQNIVEIKFVVQYRLSDARAWLFESRNPADAVVQTAESAVREVVGKMKMDTALAEERDQIAPRVRDLMQTMLDRYKVGVEVVAVNLQQGGVRPPEQVLAAFEDVLKATQERERAKNNAEAYANDVVPRAVGSAARLLEEAEGYKARIVAQAQGDAQRFNSLYAEYQKAPQVTRERLYLETMQEIYGNASKILIDAGGSNNLLYLPLDKLVEGGGAPARGAAAFTPANPAPAAAAALGTLPTNTARGNAASGRSPERDRSRNIDPR